MPKRKPTDPNTPVKPNRTQAYLDRLTKRLSRDITIYTKEANTFGRWTGKVAHEIHERIAAVSANLLEAHIRLGSLNVALDAPSKRAAKQQPLKKPAIGDHVRLGLRDKRRVRVEMELAGNPEIAEIVSGAWVVEKLPGSGIRQLGSLGGSTHKHLFLTDQPLYPVDP